MNVSLVKQINLLVLARLAHRSDTSCYGGRVSHRQTLRQY